MEKEKINWDDIFDGEEHLLIEGVHYKRTHSFSKYIYQKARERNVRVRQKIGDDNRSILVQLKRNELAVHGSSLIEPEIIDDSHQRTRIVKPSFYEDRYPFGEWFNTLFRGGQREVEVNKLDEFGKPIPIMREFEGGHKVPTGEYIKEKKIVPFEPKYILELERHKDFTGSPSKMADIICEAARMTGQIDLKTIDIDYKSERAKREDLLIIRAGPIAAKYIERKKYPDKFDLYIKYGIKVRIPLPKEVAEKWIDQLLKDGQLLLWEGKDYSGDHKILVTILRDNFPDVEFYAKKEKDQQMGWETLLLTVRKPMLARMQALPGEKGSDTMKRWMEMPEGKRIDQERDKQRLEYEEQKLLDNSYLRQKYLDKYRVLQLEIKNVEDNAPEEYKEEWLADYRGQVEKLEEEFSDLTEEDRLYLKNFKESDLPAIKDYSEEGVDAE